MPKFRRIIGLGGRSVFGFPGGMRLFQRSLMRRLSLCPQVGIFLGEADVDVNGAGGAKARLAGIRSAAAADTVVLSVIPI